MTPAGPPLHDTLTSGLIALCFGFMLYGVILCQILQYFREYKDDPPVFRAVVMIVLVGETAHTVLALYVGYHYFIENFGKTDPLGTWCLALSLEPVIMALTIVSCQYIFLHRLYFLLPQWYKPWYLAMCLPLSLCAVSLATALTVEQMIDITFDHWLKYKWLVSASFAITSFGDIFIAAMLVTTLHKNRTGIRRTDTLLDMLIIYALSSGFVTSILSTTCLLVTLLEGNKFTIIPVSVVATKMYAVAVLLVLNARRGLAERADAPLDTEWLGLSALQCKPPVVKEPTSLHFVQPQHSIHVPAFSTIHSNASPNSFPTARVPSFEVPMQNGEEVV